MKKQIKNVQAEKPKAQEKQRKGFAAMKHEDVIRIARMGGLTVSKDRNRMRELGALGGASRKTKNTKGK